MATKDGFDPDDALPLFLSADELEPSIGGDRAVISLRFVMAGILVATATAIGVSSVTGGAYTVIAVDPTKLRGVNCLKLRSGTSGTPVPQTNAVNVQLLTRVCY